MYLNFKVNTNNKGEILIRHIEREDVLLDSKCRRIFTGSSIVNMLRTMYPETSLYARILFVSLLLSSGHIFSNNPSVVFYVKEK
jgi:hypothetical protein